MRRGGGLPRVLSLCLSMMCAPVGVGLPCSGGIGFRRATMSPCQHPTSYHQMFMFCLKRGELGQESLLVSTKLCDHPLSTQRLCLDCSSLELEGPSRESIHPVVHLSTSTAQKLSPLSRCLKAVQFPSLFAGNWALRTGWGARRLQLSQRPLLPLLSLATIRDNVCLFGLSWQSSNFRPLVSSRRLWHPDELAHRLKTGSRVRWRRCLNRQS